MKKDNLNPFQAYRAMLYFLQAYYEKTGADEIGALLGSMQLLQDGMPADSAIWAEWLLVASRALSED